MTEQAKVAWKPRQHDPVKLDIPAILKMGDVTAFTKRTLRALPADFLEIRYLGKHCNRAIFIVRTKTNTIGRRIGIPYSATTKVTQPR